MNRFIFFIIYLLNFTVFASEQNTKSSKVIEINNVKYVLVYEKLKHSIQTELYLQKKLIGTLNYHQKKEKDKYEIIYLFIKNDFRLKGYGKILLNIICNQLFNDGASQIVANPLPFEKIDDAEFFCLDEESEEKLCIFYEKSGFKRDNQGNMILIKK